MVATAADDLLTVDGLSLPAGEVPQEYHQTLWTKAMQELIEEVARQEAAGISTHATVHMGPVVPRILDDLDVGEMIVMASHGEGGVRRWLTGSVAEKLIHAGAAPVILVPTTARQSIIAESPKAGRQARLTSGVLATPAALAWRPCRPVPSLVPSSRW